ncbi:MAG: hypothetical protein GC184_12095 [Rhizobiales bacterium]|nr:hypothetical protein [Hyphomicrobiales bacterium]
MVLKKNHQEEKMNTSTCVRALTGKSLAVMSALFLGTGLSFAVAPALVSSAHAEAVTVSPGIERPTEASGEDLYHRGYYPEAMAEWKKAVEQNKDAGAAYRLGEEYLDAKFVKRDIEQALKYYKFGAEGGDMRAQMDYGMMYDKGYGVKSDLATAAKWYEASAQQNFGSAQFNIGVMYEEGAGVEKDPVKAYMYLLLASQNGFAQFAGPELDKLSTSMKTEDIKKANQMARDFKAAHAESGDAEKTKESESL